MIRAAVVPCAGLVAILALPSGAWAQAVPTGQGATGNQGSGGSDARASAPGSETPQAPSPAQAEQEVTADIIVTAQKRSERLSDVPLSITAVSGDQLAKQRITTTADLERIVPGFTFQPTGTGAPVFAIRGIGFLDTALTVAPAVSIYLDQVPLPFSIEAEGVTLDLERLEALKGPQGTLFGQNSTGGAINYIAAKPTPELHAGGRLTYARFNEVDAEAFLSGPLSDTVTARVAGRYERRDAWQRSYTREDSLGRRSFFTGRGLLDWKPSPGVKLELSINGWRDRSESQAAQYRGYAPASVPGRAEQAAVLPTYPIAPLDIRSAEWDANTNLRRDDKFFQVSLRGDFNVLDRGTLTYIGSYMKLNVNTPVDQDGTAFQDLLTDKIAQFRTFYQELRGTGTFGPLRLTLGGNIQNDRTRETQDTQSLGSNQRIGPFLFNGFATRNTQQIDTFAAFGAADLTFSDHLTAQGSVRYTHQDHKYAGCLADRNGGLARAFSFLSTQLSGSPTTIPAESCATLGVDSKPSGNIIEQLNEGNLSYRLSLNYKPGRNSLLYANITKGYKAGSFPLVPAIRATQLVPVTQESLIAYEAGFKVSALQRRVSLTGAAFYYKYSNKQINGFIDTGVPFGNLPGLVNIPRSSVRGAELELSANPVEAVRFSAGATYVDSRVDSDFLVPNSFGTIANINGEAFPNTPKLQLIGDFEYSLPVGGVARAFVGGGVRYRTSSYAAVGRTPQFLLRAYALVDLRAGYEKGPVRIEIFGRNVTNKRYVTQVERIIDTIHDFTGMPATYGITLGYRY